ncbi:MAG: restriction endonuclease subunit R, partial [Acidobacteria bacterium]|nr:restriction endonuclease subunit R [Acidobacteriota bacterium]
IYIGDTSTFKKLVEEDDAGITLEEDAVAGSLFESIGDPGTSIDILIGAKKFMEGWNSWRVSNMGLLNVGRQEGSQIIQLFGRGVRLRGRGFSLKRSAALDGKHPDHVGLLETLNIFAVRANYMSQLREYLEKEGVETEGYVELPLFIRTNKSFLKKGLVVPRVPEGRDFVVGEDIVLEADPSVNVRVDMSLRVQALESSPSGITGIDLSAGREQVIPEEALEFVDWEKAYLDLLEYKVRKPLANLVIRPLAIKRILLHSEPVQLYKLVADEPVVQPRSFAETALLQEAVVNILRKYADVFYRKKREQWDCSQMVYRTVDETDPNLSFNKGLVRECASACYVVKVKRSEHRLVSQVARLIADVERLYHKETRELPRIHFDRHLYQPLLVEYGDEVGMTPPGLNQSERQFVQDLKDYWLHERTKSLAKVEVFLLRNLSRGTGLGFFEERGFYPDFILWIREKARQRIVFLEPHGMLHSDAYAHDQKGRLHLRLPDLAKEIGERTGRKDVTLDSWIISATPFEELRKKYDDGTWNRERFAEAHILFMDRSGEYDYVKRIFAGQLTQTCH